MGRLTTHVLDVMNGRPGAGVHLTLYRVEEEGRVRVAEAVTNADGRCDAPLLEAQPIEPGIYEIVFEVGAYFAANGATGDGPAFLDRVPIRFGIADGSRHHHVPLLVSPFGYTTYRGS